MKMLERILEQKIKPNPNNFKYFCYKWTNLDTLKWYFGYHKGEVWDGYWQSSEDPELKKDFSNPNNNWRYEIPEWFKTEAEAKRFEGRFLRKQTTRSNPMSYNIHEGAKPIIDIDKAPIMFERIQGGEFETKTGDKKELDNLDGYQVRYIDHPKSIQYIADMIEENGGSVELTNPLVIATGVHASFGVEKARIGGSHTMQGIKKAKSATEYKYIEVDLSDWHRVEINQLGLLLNPEEEIKREANVDEDYEKHLLDLYEETGIEPYAYEANAMLVGFGLNTRARNRIANKVQKKVEAIKYEKMTGKTWKKWDSRSAEAKDLMSDYRLTDKTLVMMMSSLKMSFDNIVNQLLDSDFTKVVVVVHHPSDTAKKMWQTGVQERYINLMETFIEPAGFDFEFEEAPTNKSDKA